MLCLEFVAHTPDGLDHIAFVAHLGSELFDMSVNGAGIPEIIIVPYVIQYLFSGERDAGILHEILQKLKLLKGKLQLLTVHRTGVSRGIEHYAAVFKSLSFSNGIGSS